MRTQPTRPLDGRGRSLAVAGALSAGGCSLIAWSAWMTETRLGAPLYWAWILTGLQVVALWAAGQKQWWAWLLGAGVQPMWIAYALLTGQVGFIPGCLVSAAVQVYNFLRPGVLSSHRAAVKQPA